MSGFKDRFPRWITLVLGLLQLLITAAVIGLEFGSIYIDLAHGTIWIGFWAGLVFIMTFMMMLFITCCCRGRCCATYVLIMNILSLVLGCVIIYFDQHFMKNLCQCYLTDSLCCAVRGVPQFSSNYQTILQNCTTISTSGNVAAISAARCPSTPSSKLVYIQAQLGVAVGMIVVCAIYILVYLFACFGICFKERSVGDKGKGK